MYYSSFPHAFVITHPVVLNHDNSRMTFPVLESQKSDYSATSKS